MCPNVCVAQHTIFTRPFTDIRNVCADVNRRQIVNCADGWPSLVFTSQYKHEHLETSAFVNNCNGDGTDGSHDPNTDRLSLTAALLGTIVKTTSGGKNASSSSSNSSSSSTPNSLSSFSSSSH